MATSRVAAFLMVCLAGAGLATAGVTLDVVPSSAPNVYGSPSWGGYCVNAMNSLENGLGDIGDRNTNPTAYEIAPSEVPPGEIAVTSFPSWRGEINPPVPFNNEHGNRMHFGLHAYGDGTTQFCLEDLTFEFHSSDPWDSLIYTGDFIGYSYNGTTRYGINWGPDRVKGGGDDVKYTAGNGTTLVDEIVYVGVGNAWWPMGADPQAAMNEYVAFVADYEPIIVSCEYKIKTYTGDASVNVVAPDPLCSTFAAQQVTENSAVLEGDVVEDNGLPCEYRFVYWPDGGEPVATDWTGPVYEGEILNLRVHDLTPGTLYHYRIEVRNASGMDLGNIRDFVTIARLTISSGPNGSVTNPGTGVFLGPVGKSIAVEAQAAPGYLFGGWTGSAVDAGLVKDPTAASTTVKFKGDQTLKANFKAKIIWVSFHGTDAATANAATAGFIDAPDKGYTDLLKANGYDVTRYVQTGTPDVNVLNAAALVIISRSVASGSFNTAAATRWNTQITAPMIVTNGYLTRKSRLGLMTGSTIPDSTGDIKLTATVPNHPVFAGIALTDATMDANFAGICVYPDGVTLARGISIITEPADAEATVLATVSQTSAATGPAGAVMIAEYPAGATVEHDGPATDVLAGPRLIFLTGSREANGKNSEGTGMIDLTADGQKMFLNAVEYMLAKPEEIPVVNPSFEDPNAGKIKGWNGEGVAGTPAIDIPGWASDAAAADSGVEQGWGATDGTWTGFLMNGDPFTYQLTDYVIQAGDVFNLKVDAKNNWAATKFMMILYCDNAGVALPVATQEVDLTDAMQRFSMWFGADAAPDCIGKKIGIEFANSTPGSGTAWLGLDRVSLSVLPGE